METLEVLQKVLAAHLLTKPGIWCTRWAQDFFVKLKSAANCEPEDNHLGLKEHRLPQVWVIRDGFFTRKEMGVVSFDFWKNGTDFILGRFRCPTTRLNISKEQPYIDPSSLSWRHLLQRRRLSDQKVPSKRLGSAAPSKRSLLSRDSSCSAIYSKLAQLSPRLTFPLKEIYM